MAEQFMNEYYAGGIDGVDVVYSRMIGSSRTAPVVFALLPMELPAPPDEAEDAWTMEERVPYEFVPSADIMMDRLLPMTIRLRLFQCFMEAAVTEHIARMTSMHSAGESAEDMIQSLTVKYNRTRQAQITTELAEILGGRTALE
jgi:F-type H+-transporting ATPase subunit gamma